MFIQNQNNADYNKRIPIILGTAMLTIGGVILLEQYLRTGWLLWSVFALVGLVFLAEGTLNQKLGWQIPGGLLSGAGIGLLLSFNRSTDMEIQNKIGIFLLCIADGNNCI